MFGAIIGDITANRYGYDSRHIHDNTYSYYTLYTIALTDFLLTSHGPISKEIVYEYYRKWSDFASDLKRDSNIYPCLSVIGWLYSSLEKTIEITTELIDCIDPKQRAKAIAFTSLIYLARKKYNKEQIVEYLTFLNFDQDSLFMQAVQYFIDGENYHKTIYLALQDGQDSAFKAVIAGAIAEAYYGVPNVLMIKAVSVVEKEVEKVMIDYSIRIRHENPFLIINEGIERAIIDFHQNSSKDTFNQVLSAIDVGIDFFSRIVIPVSIEINYHSTRDKTIKYHINKHTNHKGSWLLGYTNHLEAEKGNNYHVMVTNFYEFIQYALSKNVNGILLNQHGYEFYLDRSSLNQINQSRKLFTMKGV